MCIYWHVDHGFTVPVPCSSQCHSLRAEPLLMNKSGFLIAERRVSEQCEDRGLGWQSILLSSFHVYSCVFEDIRKGYLIAHQKTF